MVKPHSKDLRIGRVSLPGQVYLITTVVSRRREVFRDLMAARELIAALRYQQEVGNARTLAFVVMPDYLHWLMELGARLPFSEVVGTVKGYSARRLRRVADGEGRLWQAGFHDHAVRAEEDLRALARYVIYNPVRSGLVESVRNYPHWDAIWV
jgi:putative transposase